MEFKEKLEILIKRSGCKKTDFAAALGITYRALANYLSGSRFPRDGIIHDMAALLEVSPELLKDDSINITLNSRERLYFYGSSDEETRESADKLLDEVKATFGNDKLTALDKTALYNCISEIYFAEKAKAVSHD